MGHARRPPILVLMVIAALSAASISMMWVSLRGLDALSKAVSLPLPVLVIAFAVTEMTVVHLHFKSQSGGVALTEVPLILGALFAPPVHVWIAMTLGAAYFFGIVKRQSAVKTAFNIANKSLQAATALVIMHAFIGDPLGPSGWIIAAIAGAVSEVGGIIALIAVVTIMERRFAWSQVKHTAGLAVLASVSNVGLALIAASLIDYRPVSLALLIGPIALAMLAYRTAISEREQRERLEFMHESSAEIREMRDQSALAPMLSSTAARLRARRGDLVLLPMGASARPALWFSSDDGTSATRPLGTVETGAARQIADSLSAPRLLAPSELGTLVKLFQTDLEGAMVGAMRVDDRTLGLIAISNRLGDVAKFTKDDVALFSTVVDQLTLALENDQLGQTVSQLKRVERELSAQANHDALTGLANRTLLASVMTRALQDKLAVTLLYIDLDDFKRINDELGHQAGDIVLVETSRRIAELIGRGNCVARVGGDEFAVALINALDDIAIAHALLQVINEPISAVGHEAIVGASIGVTRAQAGDELPDLIARADAAMYSAKGTGKGAVAFDELTIAHP